MPISLEFLVVSEETYRGGMADNRFRLENVTPEGNWQREWIGMGKATGGCWKYCEPRGGKRGLKVVGRGKEELVPTLPSALTLPEYFTFSPSCGLFLPIFSFWSPV